MTRFGSLAALVVFAVSPVKASPSLCEAASYLGDQIPGSLDLPLSLSEDGKAYPIRVKSAVTQGYSRNILCFQYQLVNTGIEAIPLAFWNLVDDYAPRDLNKQESRFRNRSRPTMFDDAVRAPTKVKGLRAAEISATAWRTVEDVNKSKEANASDRPMFSYAKASSLDGAVANAVKSGLLPDEDVAVFDYDAAKGKAPAVSDLIGLDIGTVFSTSGMDLKEKASSYTLLKVQIGDGSSARPDVTSVKIFSPFLSALGKKPTETAEFLDSVSRFTKEAVPVVATSTQKAEVVPSPTYGFGRKFYVVEHPVTIEWLMRTPDGAVKPSVQCIRIASYSPFPVSLNERFCVR